MVMVKNWSAHASEYPNLDAKNVVSYRYAFVSTEMHNDGILFYLRE
jgi:hypothetical protein